MPIAFDPMPALSYVYEARAVGRCHDGDTAAAELRLGVGVIAETNLRFFGINAPELYVIVDHHRVLNPPGDVARAATQQWLDSAAAAWTSNLWPLVVLSKGFDKFGNRVDAIIWRKIDGLCLNQWLLDNGFAVVMAG